ncbi:hypothetical protein EUX98_g1521 [Antrodiella citrinella]|uniref:AB hydrolase-1 domain-containing protein n=1 Tax=Antrodiella citrinella TaxID=2447956 RepID=A0A4S4N466_9APHY|nr:hypothetical protein EUX98_g1521 [Antrodiella citrinella]
MAEVYPPTSKDIVVSRGLKYRYHYAPPTTPGKVTFLFLHGFPSTGRDWRKISIPLEKLGYGIFIPDMLGYGGTDKPTDLAEYRMKLIAKDVVDLLDKENIEKVVAVGHDWGSWAVARLATYFPERFHAFAFLAVPYAIPDPTGTLEQATAFVKSLLGYEPYGYWDFFNEDDADKVLLDHLDSALGIVYAKDARKVWREILCPKDVIKQALLSDYTPADGIASFITEEDLKFYTKTFREQGFRGPLCWYKSEIRGLHKPDEATVPLDRYLPPTSTPLFFGAALHDVICQPQIGKFVFGLEQFKNHNITIKEFEGDHWLILSHGEELARELDAWVEGIVVPTVEAK